jgi:hypothetical protein
LCRGTGTSFATALVSGLAALLMSLDVRSGRKPSGTRVRQALLGSADPCLPDRVELCSAHLSGRLNLDRAVDRMLGSSEAGADLEGTVTTNDVMAASLAGGQAGTGGARHGHGGSDGLALADGPRPAPPAVGGLQPADCGCGCGGKCNGDCGCGGKGGHGEAAKASEPRRVQLVYAIGRLGVSFPSQTRRDAIWRATRGAEAVASRTPEIDLRPVDNASLRELLGREPYQAQSVVWVLSRTEVPMYAIVPSGAFAAETYEWLVREWADGDVEFISLPGFIAGQVTLYDGLTVDAVVPDLRGMYSWNSRRYIDALAEESGGRTPAPRGRTARPATMRPRRGATRSRSGSTAS